MGKRFVSLAFLGAFGAVVQAAGCTSSEGDAGDPVACGDLLVQELCFDCLETACCDEVRACIDDSSQGGCAACIRGDGASCAASPVAIALFGCIQKDCPDACGEGAPGPQCDAPAKPASGGACAPTGDGVACNPLTNAECQSDEVCDFDTGGFRCFPGPNDEEVCQPCGVAAGFCGEGMSCFKSVTIGVQGVAIAGACARTCCDDGDCGSGVCSSYIEVGDARVGVCLEKGAE